MNTGQYMGCISSGIMFSVAVVTIIFLVYREMDEVHDEDMVALIQEKTMHVTAAMMIGYLGYSIGYLLRS